MKQCAVCETVCQPGVTDAAISQGRNFRTEEYKQEGLQIFVTLSATLFLLLCFECRPGSSVGIVTEYGLDRPGSNPGGDEIFRPSRSAPGAHPTPCKMDTESLPGVKCGRGVLLTTHPLLVPRSWKSRAIPLPTLWATPGLQRDHCVLNHTLFKLTAITIN